MSRGVQQLFATVSSAARGLFRLRGLVGGQYLRIAAGLLASPAIARGLGVEGRGTWALIASFDLATTQILMHGTPAAFSYFYIANPGRAERDLRLSPFRQANWIVRRTAAASCLLGTGFFLILGLADLLTAMTVGFGLVLLTTPFAGVHQLARQYATVSRKDIWVSILDGAPAVIQASVFLALFGSGALTLTNAIVVVVAMRIVAASIARFVWPHVKSTRASKQFRSFGWRSLPTTLGQLAQGRIDQLAILAIGRSALGVWAVAAVVGNVMLPLYQSSGQDLFRTETLDLAAWRRALSRTCLVWVIASAIGVAGLGLIPVLYGDQYSEAGFVALFLSLGSLGYGLFVICRAWIDRAGRPELSSAVMITHVALVGLCVPFVALEWGLRGAAVVSMILQLIRGGLALFVRSRWCRDAKVVGTKN